MKIEDDLSVIELILGYGVVTLVFGTILVISIWGLSLTYQKLKRKELKNFQWKKALKEFVGAILFIIIIFTAFHVLLFVLGLPVYGIVELFK